jgi:glycosyltransferase involved in cell wall biosynthesis
VTSLPRVFWLTTEFFPPQTGGTGVIASRLSHALAERGVQLQVITRQTLPYSAVQERLGKLGVQRVGPAGLMKGVGWRAIPAMCAYLVRLMTLLVAARRRYDLVMISGMKTIPLAAVPICRLLGKKSVIRIESPFEIAEPIAAESLATMGSSAGRWLSRILMVAQRMTLRRADRVVAISAEIALCLRGLGCPEARIARIPNAIDLTNFTPIEARERRLLRSGLRFPEDRTIMLYVGRLSRAKGVMMLMQSLPELLALHPELYLVLVGSGRESWDNCEEEVVAYIRTHHLDADVVVAGHSDRVHEYLQAADLFVSPSDYEGFGLTIVEALACALPVITTAVGIAVEIVRHNSNGFLCPPKEPRALRAAIELALQERHRWPEIGRLARESTTRFDLPRVIEQYLALCVELVGVRTAERAVSEDQRR